MSARAKPFMSPQEYLDAERASEIKHEYYAGERFAMAGASERQPDAVFQLAAIDCTLSAADVYEKVIFDATNSSEALSHD